MHYDPRKLGANCNACPLKGRKPIPYTPPPRKAKLAIVGEAPGTVEEHEGRYFSGPSGDKLDAIFRHNHASRDEISINNALQCRPNRKLTPREWSLAIACCRPRLVRELGNIPLALAVGRKALASMTGRDEDLKSWAGCITNGIGELENLKVIATYHPAAAMRGKPELLPVFYRHVGFSVQLANRTRKPMRWPTLVHCKTESGEISEAMLDALKKISKAPIVGYDTETAGASPFAPLTAVGLASRAIAVSIPWPPERFGKRALADKITKLVKQILASAKITKVAHNAAYDRLVSRHHGLPLEGPLEDTILMDFVIRPLNLHALQFALACETIVDPWKRMFKSRNDEKGAEHFIIRDDEHPRGTTAIALTRYNAKDAYAGLALFDFLTPQLSETHRGQELYEGLKRRSVIAAKMRINGARVIVENLEAYRAKFQARRDAPLQRLQKIAAKVKHSAALEFNPRSPKHLSELYFDKLGVRPLHWSESGAPSIDKKALLKYSVYPNEACRVVTSQLQEYRQWDKLNSFVEKLALDDAGFVYPEPKIYGTKGGRWSYEARGGKLNPQTVPKPRGDLPGLQGLIGPRPCNWICPVDYSQLEARIVAFLSRAPLLEQWYREGADVHAKNAEALFGKNYEKHQRTLAKRFMYGLLYGGGARTIWMSLAPEFPGLLLETIENMIEAFYRVHARVRQWQRELEEIALQRGYVEVPLTGLRQYFPGGMIEPTKVRNYPIQGTAAALLDRAIEEVDAQLNETQNEFILFQRHDELVVEGPNPMRLREIVLTAMQREVVLDGRTTFFPADFSASPISWEDANTDARSYKNDIDLLEAEFLNA